jgi:hypothetical protein
MFDQLGGLERLVRGKTVSIKLNMTGPAADKLNNMPNQITHGFTRRSSDHWSRCLVMREHGVYACWRARRSG